MNLRGYQRELAAIRARTRKAYVLSFGAHAVLVIWWALHGAVTPDAEAITEITWIEEPLPQPVAMAAAVPTPPAARAETPEPEPRETPAPAPAPEPAPQKRFPREMRRADSAPKPQSTDAVQDRLDERLASLKRGSSTRAPRVVTPVAASTMPSMAIPDPTGTARRPAPTNLSRGDSKAPAPVELRRAPAPTSSAQTARRARVETQVASSPTMPARIDTTLERTVAGASLVGPVADRPLESLVTPTYPEWAQRDAVEASVTLFFKVMPDGRIKEPVLVQKTSGHRDFDRNAIRALLRWRFAPLDGGASGDQWGEITFHYRLHDTVQH